MITAILVARIGSTRLPGKALLPILGKPMLEHLVDRVRAASTVQQVVLATTERGEDDALASLAERLGIGCVRGSADDVLGRVAAAAAAAGANPIVQLLGDNPLVHGDLIDDVVAFYRAGGYDHAANVTTEFPHAPAVARRFPIGIRVEVTSADAFARLAREATDAHSREHSTSFIYGHPDRYRLGYFEATGRWAPLHRPELTFAVNHRENFELITAIFEREYGSRPNFSLLDALAAFDEDPSLLRLMGVPAQA